MDVAPFGGPSAGIEFAADWRWYFLRLEGRTLVRETGFGQGGTYEILDTSSMNGPGHFQLNLNFNTGGTTILQWTLSAQPQLLLVDTMGIAGGLYSHVPGSPACSESPPRAPADGCRVTGCSGQICAEHEVDTTCEWNDSYACYRDARCERQPDGNCDWAPTEALQACLLSGR